MKLWSDEYFQDMVNRHIKDQIHMKYFAKHGRRPTYREYVDEFSIFIRNATLQVLNVDVGIFNDDENKWYQPYSPEKPDG